MMPQRPGPANEETFLFDVVIVGGSFAGLATAMQLRGFRVLIVDQYPIGAHQTSTCGVPLSLVRAFGVETAILEAHEEIVLHTCEGQLRFALPEAYATLDYETACQALLTRTDAEIRLARASGLREGGLVMTSAGPVVGRFVVDAAGWRSLRGQSISPPAPMPFAGRGIETELPVRPDVGSGLHFFVERRRIEGGYAWIFPCGDRARIGLYSSNMHARLRERLGAFVSELGLVVGATHGGVMPMVRRDPIVDGLFLVGDAAGQCLPVSAEGIRSALLHGAACGRFIAAALDGSLSRVEAERRYHTYVRRTSRFQRRLRYMQALVDRGPERAMALLAKACSPQPISHRILRFYLNHSGWLGEDELPGHA